MKLNKRSLSSRRFEAFGMQQLVAVGDMHIACDRAATGTAALINRVNIGRDSKRTALFLL